ncbi:nucleoside recognition domain-containing protein [Paenibacillus sp. MMS20-IR301]|uniref:nucleoside recognition domain-containing protein n=1 Tax=Paenibacillus sp. MMS20-IR301 TaxID=2895946 RepID=UPI0028EAC752|nr:nucleoside recognition domain-containing protein [Paenibacillus sp. MMS20-IR301]WNS45531.1 nucleoside recognition protein [Paenibacillus sp. MMS20-IR301]
MINFKIRRGLAGSAVFVPGAAAIVLAIAIVLAPEASFNASLEGLKLWWTIVFPALLPFLILSEMLNAFGFVHGVGVLLEPLMRRLFRLPGAGGWTLVMGITAGFPGGAGAVRQLHKQGILTDKEAGSMASIVHYASPVTLLIVIGTAFLHSPAAGYALLAIHWLSGLAAGSIAVRLGAAQPAAPIPAPAAETAQARIPGNSLNAKKASLPGRIHQAVLDARSRDGRGFGKVLGESVSAAVQNLMIVGGYMIMFAVVVSIISTLLPQLPPRFTAGLLEIHLGARAMVPEAVNSSFILGSRLGPALLSAALAWSGICAQLQALTLLRPAQVRFLPFAAVRLLHAALAFALTAVLWQPLMNTRAAVLPVFTGLASASQQGSPSLLRLWSFIPQMLGLQGLLLLLFLVLSAAVRLFSRHRRPSG